MLYPVASPDVCERRLLGAVWMRRYVIQYQYPETAHQNVWHILVLLFESEQCPHFWLYGLDDEYKMYTKNHMDDRLS